MHLPNTSVSVFLSMSTSGRGASYAGLSDRGGRDQVAGRGATPTAAGEYSTQSKMKPPPHYCSSGGMPTYTKSRNVTARDPRKDKSSYVRHRLMPCKDAVNPRHVDSPDSFGQYVFYCSLARNLRHAPAARTCVPRRKLARTENGSWRERQRRPLPSQGR